MSEQIYPLLILKPFQQICRKCINSFGGTKICATDKTNGISISPRIGCNSQEIRRVFISFNQENCYGEGLKNRDIISNFEQGRFCIHPFFFHCKRLFNFSTKHFVFKLCFLQGFFNGIRRIMKRMIDKCHKR